MKLITDEKQEGFKPFRITLEVESVQEARLLYHVFNRLKLKDAIFDPNGYALEYYNKFIVDDITDNEIKDFIRKAILPETP